MKNIIVHTYAGFIMGIIIFGFYDSPFKITDIFYNILLFFDLNRAPLEIYLIVTISTTAGFLLGMHKNKNTVKL